MTWARGGLVVDADDLSDEPSAVSLDWLAATVLDTLEGEGVVNGSLDLVLVTEAEMARLNEHHMGHSGPTDVLSFPLDADEPDRPAAAGPVRHLGDVVISPVVARHQAPHHAGTFEAEMALLTIHGVLHVLGHDHADPEEAAAMQERERVHLAARGFTRPAESMDSSR